MAATISTIRSAAVDGRLSNPIFRKSQLQKLHEKLSQNSAEIQATIQADTGYSRAEVVAEYWLAVKLVKDAYDGLSHDASLKDEYRIARSQNDIDGREPVGIVVIEAARHAYLFSLLSALVPALAAGNCIIVKIAQDMLETPRLVLRLINDALDSDIFLVTRDQVTHDTIRHRHLTVLQNGTTEPALATQIVSEPSTRIIAVVERDADLKLAARELAKARFSLRGRSPYAPDLVYVNEWVKKIFLAALTEEVIRISPHPQGGVGLGQSDRPTVSRQLQDRIAQDRHVSIVSSNGTGFIVDVEDKSPLLSGEKIQEPLLVVHAVRSIDAAIDLANRNGRLGCAYVFAQPAAAKYICQFIDSPLSIVNHVPAKLLFHPMAPKTLNAHSNPFKPYDELLFSLNKAHFINPPSDYTLLDKALSLGRAELLEPLTKLASTITPFKRADSRPDIGFFEQGIVTGGLMLLSTIFAVAGVCCYYWMGVPVFLRRL